MQSSSMSSQPPENARDLQNDLSANTISQELIVETNVLFNEFDAILLTMIDSRKEPASDVNPQINVLWSELINGFENRLTPKIYTTQETADRFQRWIQSFKAYKLKNGDKVIGSNGIVRYRRSVYCGLLQSIGLLNLDTLNALNNAISQYSFGSVEFYIHNILSQSNLIPFTEDIKIILNPGYSAFAEILGQKLIWLQTMGILTQKNRENLVRFRERLSDMNEIYFDRYGLKQTSFPKIPKVREETKMSQMFFDVMVQYWEDNNEDEEKNIDEGLVAVETKLIHASKDSPSDLIAIQITAINLPEAQAVNSIRLTRIVINSSDIQKIFLRFDSLFSNEERCLKEALFYTRNLEMTFDINDFRALVKIVEGDFTLNESQLFLLVYMLYSATVRMDNTCDESAAIISRNKRKATNDLINLRKKIFDPEIDHALIDLWKMVHKGLFTELTVSAICQYPPKSVDKLLAGVMSFKESKEYFPYCGFSREDIECLKQIASNANITEIKSVVHGLFWLHAYELSTPFYREAVLELKTYNDLLVSFKFEYGCKLTLKKKLIKIIFNYLQNKMHAEQEKSLPILRSLIPVAPSSSLSQNNIRPLRWRLFAKRIEAAKSTPFHGFTPIDASTIKYLKFNQVHLTDGFAVLNASRQDVFNALYTCRENPEDRDSLYGVIDCAFFLNRLAVEPYKEFLNLSEEDRKSRHVTQELFCAYVDEFLEDQALDSNSFLLYLEVKNRRYCIWEKSETNPAQLVPIHLKANGDGEIMHLLREPNGYCAFTKLIPREVTEANYPVVIGAAERAEARYNLEIEMSHEEHTSSCQLAADQGNSRAQYEYAESLNTAYADKKTKQLALSYYKKSATGNYIPAQIKYAKLCQFGFDNDSIYFKPDLISAFRFYEKCSEHLEAVDLKHYITLLNSGVVENNEIIPPNKKLANKLLKKAADLGDPEAQYNYFLFLESNLSEKSEPYVDDEITWYLRNYMLHDGIDHDDFSNFLKCKRDAKQNEMWRMSEGHHITGMEALSYLKQSADKKYFKAILKYAELFAEGYDVLNVKIVLRDQNAALTYYKMAAEINPEGKFHYAKYLEFLASNMGGYSAFKKEAEIQYTEAATLGYEPAKKKYIEMELEKIFLNHLMPQPMITSTVKEVLEAFIGTIENFINFSWAQLNDFLKSSFIKELAEFASKLNHEHPTKIKSYVAQHYLKQNIYFHPLNVGSGHKLSSSDSEFLMKNPCRKEIAAHREKLFTRVKKIEGSEPSAKNNGKDFI